MSNFLYLKAWDTRVKSSGAVGESVMPLGKIDSQTSSLNSPMPLTNAVLLVRCGDARFSV
jgi:hypothetical protein